METVLEVIRNSVSSDGFPTKPLIPVTPPPQEIQAERLFFEDDDPNWGYHEEHMFDDGGEGVGTEGDPEAEED